MIIEKNNSLLISSWYGLHWEKVFGVIKLLVLKEGDSTLEVCQGLSYIIRTNFFPHKYLQVPKGAGGVETSHGHIENDLKFWPLL